MSGSKFAECGVESAALRDTLLPKLISGELCVKDAEAMIKETTT